MGGRGSSSLPKESYNRFPVSVRMGGGDATQKKEVSETVSRFMKNAKIGDVYSVGGGVGSQGGQRFEITSKGSRGMGLKWLDSNRQSLKFDRNNVKSFIANGATLVSRKK